MNPPEIDAKIEELCNLLETQARHNYRLAIEGAEAEADYRRDKALAYLRVRDDLSAGGAKVTEGMIEARVHEAVADAHRKSVISQAKHEAARDTLFATRARLDAMRTIAAGNREAVR